MKHRHNTDGSPKHSIVFLILAMAAVFGCVLFVPTFRVSAAQEGTAYSAPEKPILASTVLDPAIAGSPYTFQFSASGGTGPYTFSESFFGAPLGLTLDPMTGVFHGTISGNNSGNRTYTFSVCVTDTDMVGAESCHDVSLFVAKKPLPNGVPQLTGYELGPQPIWQWYLQQLQQQASLLSELPEVLWGRFSDMMNYLAQQTAAKQAAADAAAAAEAAKQKKGTGTRLPVPPPNCLKGSYEGSDGKCHDDNTGAIVPAAPSETGTSGRGQCDGLNSTVNRCGSCTSDAQCGGGHCFTNMAPGSIAPFCSGNSAIQQLQGLQNGTLNW